MNMDRFVRRTMMAIGVITIISFQASFALATPSISAQFAATYPTATASINKSCLLCHTSMSGSKNNLNSYGQLVKQSGVSGAGNPEATAPTTPAPGGNNGDEADADNDGISDGNEGDNDSDGDGIFDIFEPDADANDVSKASGIPLMNGGSLTIISSGYTLSDVKVEPITANNGPVAADTAFGVISFTTTAPVGGTQVVRIISTTPFPNPVKLYKVDTFGNSTVIPETYYTRVNEGNIDLRLVDGGEFDLDGIPNGIIVDPIAIGWLGGKSTCLIFTSTGYNFLLWMMPLMLLLAGIIAVRRRVS